MSKKKEFHKDILFFEDEFDSIMPLEIMVDVKKLKGFYKLSTLTFTGRTLIFQKRTDYLVKNLLQSLLLAVVLIIIMLYMFRS